MSEIMRTPYVFIGKKAEESAKYYDTVLSHGYQGDLSLLAWDAAHKFSSRFVAPGTASFRHGLIYGNKAHEAAAYYDQKWDNAFACCPETERRATMRSIGRDLVVETEDRYGVHITVKDRYYY